MKTFIAILFSICFTNIVVAQQITITGTQQRIPGSNAILTSDKVKISKNMVIVSVTGNNNGFWILKNGKSEKAFWTENQILDAIGYKLSKGEYQVFPNIKTGEKKASVTIKLQ